MVWILELDFLVGFFSWIFDLDFELDFELDFLVEFSRSYLRLRPGYRSDQTVFVQVNLDLAIFVCRNQLVDILGWMD